MMLFILSLLFLSTTTAHQTSDPHVHEPTPLNGVISDFGIAVLRSAVVTSVNSKGKATSFRFTFSTPSFLFSNSKKMFNSQETSSTSEDQGVSVTSSVNDTFDMELTVSKDTSFFHPDFVLMEEDENGELADMDIKTMPTTYKGKATVRKVNEVTTIVRTFAETTTRVETSVTKKKLKANLLLEQSNKNDNQLKLSSAHFTSGKEIYFLENLIDFINNRKAHREVEGRNSSEEEFSPEAQQILQEELSQLKEGGVVKKMSNFDIKGDRFVMYKQSDLHIPPHFFNEGVMSEQTSSPSSSSSSSSSSSRTKRQLMKRQLRPVPVPAPRPAPRPVALPAPQPAPRPAPGPAAQPTGRKTAWLSIHLDCNYQATMARARKDGRSEATSAVMRASALYERTFGISLGVKKMTVHANCGSSPFNQQCGRITIERALDEIKAFRLRTPDELTAASTMLMTDCYTSGAVGLALVGTLCGNLVAVSLQVEKLLLGSCLLMSLPTTSDVITIRATVELVLSCHQQSAQAAVPSLPVL